MRVPILYLSRASVVSENTHNVRVSTLSCILCSSEDNGDAPAKPPPKKAKTPEEQTAQKAPKEVKPAKTPAKPEAGKKTGEKKPTVKRSRAKKTEAAGSDGEKDQGEGQGVGGEQQAPAPPAPQGPVVKKQKKKDQEGLLPPTGSLVTDVVPEPGDTKKAKKGKQAETEADRLMSKKEILEIFANKSFPGKKLINPFLLWCVSLCGALLASGGACRIPGLHRVFSVLPLMLCSQATEELSVRSLEELPVKNIKTSLKKFGGVTASTAECLVSEGWDHMCTNIPACSFMHRM